MKAEQRTVINRVLGLLALCALMTAAIPGRAASQQIYDTQADAHHDIAAAIARASRTGRNIVLIFGANW